MSPDRFEHDEDDAGSDTPPTRSYVDALLEGNMTPAQVASLRAEIARDPVLADLRAPAAPRISSRPSGAPSSFRPVEPPPPPSGPLSRPLVDLDLDLELDLGDDDDDARTLMRLPGAFDSPSQRPPSSAAPPSVESLDQTYLRALGGLSGIPSVAVPPGRLTQLPLGCQAAFIVSRLDGASTIDDLLDVSGLTRLETLRLLYELVQDGIVAISAAR